MKLKDCPLCGARAFVSTANGRYGVKCTGCYAKIVCEYEKPEQAAGAWNRRFCDAPRIALPVLGDVK